MKSAHWFSLGTFLLGLILLFVGLTSEGRLLLGVAVVVELIYAMLMGKKTNDGME